jgi:hypothetical protein
VVRSIIGITLLVLGAMTLIALLPLGRGTLTTWWTSVFAPWFGSLRWFLPFFLLLGGGGSNGVRVARPGSGWGSRCSGWRSRTSAWCRVAGSRHVARRVRPRRVVVSAGHSLRS